MHHVCQPRSQGPFIIVDSINQSNFPMSHNLNKLEVKLNILKVYLHSMVVACVTKENRGEVSLYIGSDRANQLIWKSMANISFELSICLIRKVSQKNFLNTENAKLKRYSQPRFPSLEDLAANVVSPHYAKKLPPLLCCLPQSLHFLGSQDQSTHIVFTQ